MALWTYSGVGEQRKLLRDYDGIHCRPAKAFCTSAPFQGDIGYNKLRPHPKILQLSRSTSAQNDPGLRVLLVCGENLGLQEGVRKDVCRASQALKLSG